VERIEKRIKVMVVGLPGKAISMVAEAVARRRDEMELFGYTLGKESEGFRIGGAEIVQIEPALLYQQKPVEEFLDLVAIDFTSRKEFVRFSDNVRFYRKLGIPFVAGEDRSYILGKTSVSVAIVPNVRSESCHLITPLVMKAIKLLSKCNGRKRVFHLVAEEKEAIAI
jgi:hypothetical protein